MKKNRSFLVNKFVLPPILYFRSQILYPLFNHNEDTRTNFRVKWIHFLAYIRSKIFSYDDRKIDFFIVGGQKCGTTALHSYLNNNPKIISGARKELHYFDYKNYFDEKNNIKNAKHLRALYPKKIFNNQLMIESTPNYSWWKNSLQRIYNYNKNAKLILIIRNPIKRAFSQWNMQYNLKITLDSFHDAYNNEMNGNITRESSFLSRGHYTHQIQEMWNLFGKKNVLIVESKDFRESTEETVSKIFNFLNINSKYIKIDKQKIETNSRSYHSTLDKEDKLKLINFYKKEIKDLEQLLDRNFSRWLNF